MIRLLTMISLVLVGLVFLSPSWGQNAESTQAEVDPSTGPAHGPQDGVQHANSGEHGSDSHSTHAAGHSEAETNLHGNAGKQLNDPSEIRASLAFWTLVVFGLLLAVLWKFAWGPITQALDEREHSITAQLEEVKRQNEQSRKLLADHESRLAGTADEVRRILDEARRDADAQKQKILGEAQAAAEGEKRRAVQEIEAAKNGALRELAQRSVDTAVGLAGKIVQRQLNADDHATLIGEALEKFPSRN